MKFTNLYIDGQWSTGQSGARFDVINPATEEVITSVASAEIADADRALDAAEVAMEMWAQRTPRARSEILRKAWKLMTVRLPEFARLITLKMVKLMQMLWAKQLMLQSFFVGLLKRRSVPTA